MTRWLAARLLALLLGLPLLPGSALATSSQTAVQTAAHTAGPGARSSLTVVLDDNYPPYIFRDERGELHGILKDLWALWSEKTGVPVQLRAMDWGRAQEEMLAGHADVIDTIFVTEPRLKLYRFSQPYATIEVPIYFHQSIGGIRDEASLRGFTIGVKDGDACIDHLARHDLHDLKRYPSYLSMVDGAARSEVRVFCIDTPPAIYHLVKAGIEQQFRHTKPLYSGQFHRAVRLADAPQLDWIEAGFARISAAERQTIDERWLGSKVGGINPEFLRQAGLALAATLALLVALVLWNRSLRHRVERRTADLSLALAQVKTTESRFRALFEHSHDAIFIMDGPRCIDCNLRATEMYRTPREQLIGSTPDNFSPEYQPDGIPSAEKNRHYVSLALQGQSQSFEWRNVLADGSPLDADVSLNRIDLDGQVLLQAVVRDITDKKQAEAEIERLAYFDPLTLLPNRRLFGERVTQALTTSYRQGRYGAVLCLDLDQFKQLNDTRGHHVGDLLLREVAHRLLQATNQEGCVARLGGDEFAILLEDLGNNADDAASAAEAVTERVLSAIRGTFSLDGKPYHSSTSLGICLFLGRETSLDELLKRADAAMYRAKNAGRNTARFFDPALQASLEARATLEAELRLALPDQLALYLQAKLDASGRIIGAEALLRWRHPQRGLVSPLQFIPVAEETGLIVPIGNWVIESSTALLRQWASVPSLAALHLAINVSARQFRQADFVHHLNLQVRHSGIDPAKLKLELTESAVLDNVGESIEKMRTLGEAGLTFSLDDFGTGYSSLSYLKRLPLAELKIDQSFVRDISTDPGDAIIVQTILGMAHNLKLQVVAEGVETREQHRFLLEHGCSVFQGYLFARPMPVADFVALVLAAEA